MRGISSLIFLSSSLALSGCAEMVVSNGFDAKSFHFYDPVPYLLVTVSGDCSVTSKVVAIPGAKRSVRLRGGYGSANLSAKFSGGLITDVGQQTDSKVPETLTAVAGLIPKPTAASSPELAGILDKSCKHDPEAHLYAINEDGSVNTAVDKLAFTTKSDK